MLFFSSRSRRLMLLGGLLTGLMSCVAEFDPSLGLTADVLIVDGGVTDALERQTLKLSRSRVYGGRSGATPVPGAKVEILVENTTVVSLRESTTMNGLYEAPEGFRGEAGKSYQLRFTTTDGKRYESSAERLTTVLPISKIYDQFDAKGIVNAEKTRFTPANLIYIDTQDLAEARNFYRWSWTLWDQQTGCASCQRGIFIATSGLGDSSRTRVAWPIHPPPPSWATCATPATSAKTWWGVSRPRRGQCNGTGSTAGTPADGHSGCTRGCLVVRPTPNPRAFSSACRALPAQRHPHPV